MPFDDTDRAKHPKPLTRPASLVRAARWVAVRYLRERDLPGAVPGLLGKSAAEIRRKLEVVETRLEAARLGVRPDYRPSRHVQVLGALLAESAPEDRRPGGTRRPGREDQPKASGSEALRSAT